MRKLFLPFLALALLTSCVSKKKFTALEQGMKDEKMKYSELAELLEKSRKSINDCEKLKIGVESEVRSRDAQIAQKESKIKDLEGQIDFLRRNNDKLLNQMSDLSIVSKAGAESIRKSLDQIDDQSKYIKNLTNQIQTKDSTNLALVMNLKRSLGNINDQDIDIQVKKGVVYVSLSDKMLYKSGSADINVSAETVLEKVAKVVNDHKELDILVEGHTDNVPMSNSCMSDNWDLSAKRATAVVRLLQKKFGVDPSRMTAGGRGEFSPKTTNDNTFNKQANRRTEIIITPKLDQFFELNVRK
jgi:chemotaxis protein MotB